MMPLVSVTMPCYNARETLPRALASLLAQTYPHWECIIVDDGSTDRPFDVVNLVHDERIRFHRFEENRGRATARRQALDLAQGDYLCMLDADDWIYPWKIERQVNIMETCPDLALLSTGMAIVDANNALVAVRVVGAQSDEITVHPSLDKPMMPPLAHAPSIIRMSAAKETAYDVEFRIAEDVDFLLRMALRYGYGVLPEVTYVYNEFESYSLSKMIRSMRAHQKMFSKYRAQYPTVVYREFIKQIVKELIYRFSFILGLDNHLVKRRSRNPTAEQAEAFQKAWETVNSVGLDAFAGTPYESKFNFPAAANRRD